MASIRDAQIVLGEDGEGEAVPHEQGDEVPHAGGLVAEKLPDLAGEFLGRVGAARGGEAAAQTVAVEVVQHVERRHAQPSGYVRISAELWRAELEPGASPVEPGNRIRVIAVRGLTLLVPADESNESLVVAESSEQ